MRLPAVAGAAATILLWWALSLAAGPALLPSPAAVTAAFLRLPGPLLLATGVTLAESVQGFLLAAAAGTALGTALAASGRVARAMYPALVALNAVPKLAFAPLLVVALGFGAGPKIVLAYAAIALLAALRIALFYALVLLESLLTPRPAC